MLNILLGVGIVLVLSFVVCLLDRDTREDVAQVVGSVLVLPAYIFVVLALRFVKEKPRVHRLRPRSLRYIANTVETKGWLIEREAKAVVVITKASAVPSEAEKEGK